MRKYSILKTPVNKIEKVMIYNYDVDEVYVFLYESKMDIRCFADYEFETLEDAEEFCRELGVNDEDWIYIEDPKEDSPHDLINS